MIKTMSANFDTSLTKISTSHESAYSNGMNQGAQTQRDGGLAATQLSGTQDSKPYRVTISEEALRKAGLLKDDAQTGKNGAPAENKDAAEKSSDSASNTREARELENLKRTDREVRAHEQAHVAAGGSLVRGAASFGYATGPDGKLYAVSGEVSIDSSAVEDDPGATITKMMRVVTAALAPAQPSGQDRAVASEATKTQVDAQQELSQQQMEKMQNGTDEADESKPSGTSEAKKSVPEKKPVDDNQKFVNKFPVPDGKPDNPKQTTFQTKHINIQA